MLERKFQFISVLGSTFFDISNDSIFFRGPTATVRQTVTFLALPSLIWPNLWHMPERPGFSLQARPPPTTTTVLFTALLTLPGNSYTLYFSIMTFTESAALYMWETYILNQHCPTFFKNCWKLPFYIKMGPYLHFCPSKAEQDFKNITTWNCACRHMWQLATRLDNAALDGLL